MERHQITLPRTSTDVTSVWMNEVLGRSPAWKHGEVADVKLEPIGGVDSLASAVCRAETILTSGLAVPLLIKMQVESPRAALISMYEAESYFYNQYAERAGIPIPQTYFSAFDPVEAKFVVVQDFLTDGAVGTTDVFLSVEDLLRSVLNLAELHAKWWTSGELVADPKVRRMQDLVARSNRVLQDPSQNPVPAFLRRFRSAMSVEAADYFETMPAWVPRVASMQWGPETLIHADCSSKNMMFPYDVTQPPVLFDWAFFHSGPAAYDLAVLIGSSASPRDQVDTPYLLRLYVDRLRSHGIASYGLAQLSEDYARSLMFRSYGLPLVASWNTEHSRAHVESLLPSMVAALANSGAFQIAADASR